MGLVLAVLDKPLSLESEVRSSRPEEDRDYLLAPTRLGHFWGLLPLGTLHVMLQRLVPNGISYLTPGALPPRPIPRPLLRWGLASCHFLFLELCSRAFYSVPSQPGLLKSISCHRRASIMGLTSTGTRKPLPHPGCLAVSLFLQSLPPPPVALHSWLAFAVLQALWPLPPQDNIMQDSRGPELPPKAFTPTAPGHFQGISPFRVTPS